MPLKPSVQCILHMLTKEKSVPGLPRLYAHLSSVGLSTHMNLRNHLITLLVESGCAHVALSLFDTLLHPSVHLWNSLIIGLVKYGWCRHALLLYHKMQETSLHPNGFAFVALLKACIELQDSVAGSVMHVEIAKCGLLEKDLFVGNTLMDMYAKCGSLAQAQEVFDKLPKQDVVSWNALIAGYARHELGEKALHCYKQMQEQRITPNAITFVCGLKACASTGDVHKGREIHAEISRIGLFEVNPVLGNALVDMYSKCGWLTKAQEIFDVLRVRDVITWNALIAGYSDHDCEEEALHQFEMMQLQELSPNAATFPSIFKSCGNIGAIDKGIEIHAEIARKGYLERDVAIGNALVDMYAKCGLLAKAREVFDKLSVQDVVSWTALIAGYVNCERGEVALGCYRNMQVAGVSPSAVTFVCSLRACSISGAKYDGREIHAELARNGFLEKDLSVGNALVDMYVKFGLLTDAHEAFDGLPVHDIISWTTLIGGYAENGCYEEALMCYKQMQSEGISPNPVTYVWSLKACGILGEMNKGTELHGEIAKQEFVEQDLIVGNTLVDMYAKSGWLTKAKEVFDALAVRDVVSWTALIKGYAEHERGEDALICFEQMQLEKIFPNTATLICSLKACHCIGAMDKGREIHGEILRRGLLHRDVAVGNVLIDMYAKCGWLPKAQEVFDVLQIRDVVTWNSLIAGFVQRGESTNTFRLLERMKREGKRPDLVTFASVLSVCSHAGLACKGQAYFEAMSKDYGMIPTLEHHTCMVSLLSNAGHVEKAIAAIKKLSLCPDHVMWQTILDACQKSGNLELGRMAYEQVVQLDNEDASPYVSLCNIYADHSYIKQGVLKEMPICTIHIENTTDSHQRREIFN